MQEQVRSKRLTSLLSSLAEVNCKCPLFGTWAFWSCILWSVHLIVHLFITLLAFLVKSSPKKSAINVLSEGLNKAVAVVGKVLLFVKHDNIAPLWVLPYLYKIYTPTFLGVPSIISYGWTVFYLQSEPFLVLDKLEICGSNFIVYFNTFNNNSFSILLAALYHI